ncbi:MAG: hypothetical protein JNL74_04075 [Fibrobacteres bacterium]|nr:hypothetical protein [Fibrobacterota bacterium]
MNYGKALEEVWEWRESFSKELENIPPKERVRYINEKAMNGCKKLGIKCPVQSNEPLHV